MAEQENTIPKITVDGVDYAAATLSNQSKALIGTIRAADREIRRLELQLTLARVARQTLGNSLKAELAKPAGE